MTLAKMGGEFCQMNSLDNDSIVNIAAKIKLLRKSKGVSQSEVAEIILTNQGKISRIENGDDSYDENEILAIKEHFGIANMPLTQLECDAFKKRLYHFRDLIKDRQLDEAKQLQNEIKHINILEAIDFELPMLYRLFEALLLMVDEKLEEAYEKMQELEAHLDKMTDELIYHYHRNMGFYHLTSRSFEEAIINYKQALKVIKLHKYLLSDKDEQEVYYNIAYCYTNLEYPSRAIVFIEKIPHIGFRNEMTVQSLALDIAIAINYNKIGLYEEAEEILNDCYLRANGIANKLYIGLSLQNLGVMNSYLGKWEVAYDYFGQALKIFEKDSLYHAWALYFKYRCKMEFGELAKIERELNKLEKDYEKYEKHQILIKTARHFLRIKKNVTFYHTDAVEYIENVSIPYFIERSHRLEALDCCKLLVKHFGRTNKRRKTLETNELMLKICERVNMI